jgi:hypothetical protein
MASERVLITFEVDASGAIRQVDNVKKSVKEIPAATDKASQGFSNLTKALAAIGGVVVAFRTAMRTIQGTLNFLAGSANEAAEQQKTFALLEGSIDRLGGSYARLKPILDEHFLTLQRNTEFGDTDSAEAMQQLIDTTGNLKTAYELLEPTMDLAVSKGMELQNAVKLVGMTYNGQLGTLSRYGIQLTDTQKEMLRTGTAAEKTATLVELLGDKFGGASRVAGDTTLGAWAGITNAFGDVREAIGDLIVQSDLLPRVFGAVEDVLLTVATAITEGGEKLRELEELISGMDFQPVADALRGVVDAVKAFGDEINWELVKSGIATILELTKAHVTQQLELISGTIETLAAAAGWLGEALSSDRITVEPLEAYTRGAESAASATQRVTGAVEDGIDPWAQNNEGVKTAVINWTALEEASKKASAALTKAYARIEADTKKLQRVKAFEEMTKQTQEAATSIDVVTSRIQELAKESELSTNKTRNHFEDLGESIENSLGSTLTVTILGEWDNLFELLERGWKETFEGMFDDLAEQVNEAFTGDGDRSMISAFKEFWSGLKGQIDEDPIGAMISGVGGAFTASQGSGGFAGALQGAIGGGMAGLGIAGAFALSNPVTAIIAGVLALVGGIGGFMGGGDITPETRGNINLGTGRGAITGHRDQYVDAEIEAAWIRDRVEEWNAAFDGMYEIVTMFGDSSLIELIGDVGTLDFGGRGDLNAWAQLFREQIIPDHLREVFELAIGTGLGQLGVSDAKIRELWKELDVMGTDRMIESLSTFVAAVVGMADLIDAMDWDQILDEAGMDSMERFAAMTGQVVESIQLMTTGIGEMDPIQQAETALEVQQMVTQVRQAEIQMLQQIDALQQGINQSIDAQIESIQLGGMEPGQQSQFFLDQIVGLMDLLAGGGIGSPEELSQVMSDLLSYISQYQSIMGENLYIAGDDGIVPSDWLLELLEEARGLSNEQLEGFRQEIIDQNAAILELLTMINDNLTMTQEEIILGGEIDIRVRPSDDFWIEVDSRISARLERRRDMGNWLGRP